MPAKAKPVTVLEAQRAFYIDFEGTAVDPPSLLGVAWHDGKKDHFVQHVLEEGLWPAADAKSKQPGFDCRRTNWADLGEILRRTVAQGHRMFAWSTHEATAFCKFVPGGGEWFADNIENAIVNAKAWKKANYHDVIFEKDPSNPYGGKNRLHRYFELIEYEVPTAFGPGNSAQRIKYVREMLKKKNGDYSALTPVAKGKWTKVLRHNEDDCKGLREVVLRCASGPGS